MAVFFLWGGDAMRNRSIIYIDGFNLYYGAVKNMSWKWLGIERYFSSFLPYDEIQIIKYFTAKMLGSYKARCIYKSIINT